MQISVDKQRRLVTVRNEGTRTYATLRQGLDRALETFRDGGRFRLLIDWRAFDGAAADSLGEQFNVSTQLTQMCSAIAFVCAPKWQPAVDRAEMLFAPIPCRRFEADDEEGALAWLSDGS